MGSSNDYWVVTVNQNTHVTSAWHMPRSMSEFQAVGCNVTAYPVDFRTGEETSWTEYSMAGSLMAWQTALHEYLGMFVYGVTR